MARRRRFPTGAEAEVAKALRGQPYSRKAVREAAAKIDAEEKALKEAGERYDEAHDPGFFVGLGHAGGPLPDAAAARKLAEVEADVKADPVVLNRGRFFDRKGRHLRIDEVAR